MSVFNRNLKKSLVVGGPLEKHFTYCQDDLFAYNGLPHIETYSNNESTEEMVYVFTKRKIDLDGIGEIQCYAYDQESDAKVKSFLDCYFRNKKISSREAFNDYVKALVLTHT